MTAVPRPPLARLFALGLAVHGALVAAIIAGAYLGWLPTTLAAVPHGDKLGHALLIGGLAFFLDGRLGGRPLAARWPWLGLAPVIVLAAAGAEELLQLLSPRRTASLGDFAADVVGVVLLTWASRRLAGRPARRAARGAARRLPP